MITPINLLQRVRLKPPTIIHGVKYCQFLRYWNNCEVAFGRIKAYLVQFKRLFNNYTLLVP